MPLLVSAVIQTESPKNGYFARVTTKYNLTFPYSSVRLRNFEEITRLLISCSQVCFLNSFEAESLRIEYTEWTTGNHLRHSRFVALRDDKDAREVSKEVV